jgi:anti-sigma factor RsiW
MRCDEVRDQLLDGAPARSSAAAAHLAGCPDCAGYARRVGQLDDRLRAALVVEPPPELQAQLLMLARSAARPAPAPVAAPVPLGWLRDLSTWVAALTIALAAWQLYVWLVDSTLVLGNVVEAFQLVAASPTGQLASDFGVDPLALALWVGVAIVAALVAQSRRDVAPLA